MQLIQFEGCTVAVVAPEDLEQLEADKARLDWLLSRCSVGTHVLGHKGQSHFAFQPFFTLRVQGGGREGIDDAMQNAAAIAAIERQFEDAERRQDEYHAIYEEPGGGPFSGKSDD